MQIFLDSQLIAQYFYIVNKNSRFPKKAAKN